MTTHLTHLTLEELRGGKIVEVHATGQLTAEDYRDFTPEIERLIERHGKIRVLFHMDDFHGWSPSGLWEDIKFDAANFNKIELLAVVGESKWQEWMADFCKPFTTAEIRYFQEENLEEARTWIGELSEK
jgi:hypothetical protein